MKRTLLTFLVGILVGAGGYWYLSQPKTNRTVADAQETLRTDAVNLGHSVQESFDTDKIKEELVRTGKVIREKAGKAGDAFAEMTANARITAAIKAKLFDESSLASLKIHVETADGVVTLSGTASTYEEIGKAVNLALETAGVQKVISMMQVKPK